MLIELLSPTNQVTYSVKVAEKLGLHGAIFVSELMAQYQDMVDKKKLKEVDGVNYFKINKAQLMRRTTFTQAEFNKLFEDLSALELVKPLKGDKSMIFFDVDALATIVAPEFDKSYITRVTDISSKQSKSQQMHMAEERYKNSLMGVLTIDNEEFRQAMSLWIDSALRRYHKSFNAAAVIQAEKDVVAASYHNLDVAIAIVSDAAIKGYDNMKYSINSYRASHPTVPNNIVEMSMEKKPVIWDSEGEVF